MLKFVPTTVQDMAIVPPMVIVPVYQDTAVMIVPRAPVQPIAMKMASAFIPDVNATSVTKASSCLQKNIPLYVFFLFFFFLTIFQFFFNLFIPPPIIAGDACQDRLCGPECVHGECVHDECVCHDDYQGSNCEIQTCDGPETCNHHGTCTIEHTCSCDQGYIGDFCGEQLCPDNCNDHGICLNGTCKCDNMYQGITCQAKRCNAKCALHGRCDHETGFCKCNPGYFGAACTQLLCKNDCGGPIRGVCGSDGQCQCNGGFGGDDCSR